MLLGSKFVEFIDHLVDVINHVNNNFARLAKVQCHSQVIVLETTRCLDFAMTSVHFVQPLQQLCVDIVILVA